MKKQFPIFGLALAVLHSTVSVYSPPLAWADEFSDVCGPVLGNQALAEGDQSKAYCTQAKISKTAKQFSTYKEVIFTAATAALVAAGASLVGTGACPAINYGATGSGLALDIASSIKMKDATQAVTGLMSALGGSLLTSQLDKIGSKAAKDGVAPIKQNAHDKAKAEQGHCFSMAAGTAVQAGSAILGAMSAKKAEQSALKSVKDLKASQMANAKFSLGSNSAGAAQDLSKKSAGNTGAARADVVPCSDQSGSGYLACMSQSVPEASAITSDQGLMGLINDSLRGQNLGDLAKSQAQADSGNAAGKIASAMGLGGSFTDGLKQATDVSQKALAEAGYSPTGYRSAAMGASPGKNEDLDFGKMMEGLLKQMSPEEAKSKEDPSLLVFRQLDLLPAAKIEANKDISLFVRVGYRYRKKSDDVDHLNWVSAQNQAAPSTMRDPATQNHR